MIKGSLIWTCIHLLSNVKVILATCYLSPSPNRVFCITVILLQFNDIAADLQLHYHVITKLLKQPAPRPRPLFRGCGQLPQGCLMLCAHSSLRATKYLGGRGLRSWITSKGKDWIFYSCYSISGSNKDHWNAETDNRGIFLHTHPPCAVASFACRKPCFALLPHSTGRESILVRSLLAHRKRWPVNAALGCHTNTVRAVRVPELVLLLCYHWYWAALTAAWKFWWSHAQPVQEISTVWYQTVPQSRIPKHECFRSYSNMS